MCLPGTSLLVLVALALGVRVRAIAITLCYKAPVAITPKNSHNRRWRSLAPSHTSHSRRQTLKQDAITCEIMHPTQISLAQALHYL